MKELNLISWNVNGIRAIMKKGFAEQIEELAPDVLCLQETKAQIPDAQKALEAISGYHVYLNDSKRRKGYSGTAILSKKEPLQVMYDMGEEDHDQEGRVITAEYDDFILVNVYVPNSGSELARLDYRETWDDDFLRYLKALEEMKPVIVCGEF